MNLTKTMPVIATGAEKTMTLKEITDLLGVRHDKAMTKVAEMAKEPEFGTVSILDIAYNDKGQTTKTYQLDKRQSIAVASRLNTALLMRIIDRWQELEAQQQSPAPSFHLPSNFIEALELLVSAEKEKLALTHQVEEMQPAVAALDRLTEADGTFCFRDAAKQLNLNPKKLAEWLSANNWAYKHGGAKSPWIAYQARIDAGLMMHKTTTIERDGETSIYSQPRITAKGLATISKQIEKANRTAKMLAA